MKQTPFRLEQVNTTKAAPAKKMASTAPKRKHWTDDFLKHLDAWGEELRKSKKKASA